MIYQSRPTVGWSKTTKQPLSEDVLAENRCSTVYAPPGQFIISCPGKNALLILMPGHDSDTDVRFRRRFNKPLSPQEIPSSIKNFCETDAASPSTSS